MKKISKSDWKRIEDLITDLRKQKDAISEEIIAFYDRLSSKIDDMNNTREELSGVLEDLANEAETYFDERSEKWQEGDVGQAYSSWRGQIESARDGLADTIEIPEPEPFLEDFDEALAVIDNGDLTQGPEA